MTLLLYISVNSNLLTLKYMQIRFFDWELLFATSVFAILSLIYYLTGLFYFFIFLSSISLWFLKLCSEHLFKFFSGFSLTTVRTWRIHLKLSFFHLSNLQTRLEILYWAEQSWLSAVGRKPGHGWSLVWNVWKLEGVDKSRDEVE